MKAVFVTKDTRELKDFPVPTPAAGEVLIKNVAVSSNPKDYKIPMWIAGYGSIEGNDVAGHVEAVGEGVTKFKKGDKVAAFSKMFSGDKWGAYAEYTVAPANTTFALGPKTAYEEAAALPLAYITAAIGLFLRLGLPTPDAPASGSDAPAVLIYGAATTVGVYATQLAKKAGLYVVGVASSTELAKSYGCDEVIDYRGKSTADLVDAIVAAGGGRIHHVYDAVSEGGTLETVSAALSRTGAPGRFTHVLPYSEEQLAALPQGVTAHHTSCNTAYEGDSDFAEHWFARVGEWIERGEFKSQRVTVVPGGLAGVEEGLRRLQQHEVKGEKLVYRIAETPGLSSA
ncbi:hypothetical protein JCM21900_004112 [Sporobolomyces salmonicolor]